MCVAMDTDISVNNLKCIRFSTAHLLEYFNQSCIVMLVIIRTLYG